MATWQEVGAWAAATLESSCRPDAVEGDYLGANSSIGYGGGLGYIQITSGNFEMLVDMKNKGVDMTPISGTQIGNDVASGTPSREYHNSFMNIGPIFNWQEVQGLKTILAGTLAQNVQATWIQNYFNTNNAAAMNDINSQNWSDQQKAMAMRLVVLAPGCIPTLVSPPVAANGDNATLASQMNSFSPGCGDKVRALVEGFNWSTEPSPNVWSGTGGTGGQPATVHDNVNTQQAGNSTSTSGNQTTPPVFELRMSSTPVIANRNGIGYYQKDNGFIFTQRGNMLFPTVKQYGSPNNTSSSSSSDVAPYKPFVPAWPAPDLSVGAGNAGRAPSPGTGRSATYLNQFLNAWIGDGQCTQVSNAWLAHLSNYYFQLNNTFGANAAPATGPWGTAWEIYKGVNWAAMGWHDIGQVTSPSSLLDGDIFFVAPNTNAPSYGYAGHTGVVTSIVGGGVQTYEANMYTGGGGGPMLPYDSRGGRGSWSLSGGNFYIVRLP